MPTSCAMVGVEGTWWSALATCDSNGKMMGDVLEACQKDGENGVEAVMTATAG